MDRKQCNNEKQKHLASRSNKLKQVKEVKGADYRMKTADI